MPHPDSPAARSFDWSSLVHIDVDDRARAVLDACRIAQSEAPHAIYVATGQELGALLEGLLPGMLLAMCAVAASTTFGGLVGAAIGALAGGAGAVPGAVAGAEAGLEAGLAALEAMGLAFLAAAMGTALVRASQLSISAVREAWYAIDRPASRQVHVQHAGHTLALACGELMRGVLQGIVAYLLAKGSEAAAARVPELVAKLRASRIGEGFANWIERNWKTLINDKRFQSSKPAAADSAAADAGAGASAGGGSTSPSTAKPAPAKPGPADPDPAAPAAKTDPAAKPQPKKAKKAATAAERATVLKEMNDVAATGDVSTPTDGLTLWSGGGMQGAGGAAMKSAQASGGKTLEMTPAGQRLGELNEQLGPWQDLTPAERAQSEAAWSTASERLAENASGEVNVVVDPAKVRSNAIVFDELQQLSRNDAVTGVTLTDTSGNVLSSGSADAAYQALRAVVP